MPKLLSRSLFALYFLALAFFTSCLGTPTGSGVFRVRPEGNAEGIEGRKIFAFENGRVRCGFDQPDATSNTYGVSCAAVVVTAEGHEVEATDLAPGVELDWKYPVNLDGSPIERANCRLREDGLHNDCEVTLAKSTPTKVQFSIGIRSSGSGESRVESDVVLLPYSVTSYGYLTHGQQFAAPKKTGEETEGAPLVGYQPSSIEATKASFGTIRSVCTQKREGHPERVFFSADGNIFELKDGVVTHYAGSANPMNAQNFSSRQRVQLPEYVSIACSAHGIYAWRQMDVVFIQDEGPVHRLTFDPNDPRDENIWLKDDQVCFSTSCYKISATGQLQRVEGDYLPPSGSEIIEKATGIVANVSRPCAKDQAPDGSSIPTVKLCDLSKFAASSEGEVYFSDFTAVRKISKTGVIGTVAGMSVYALEEGVSAFKARLQVPFALAFDSSGSLLWEEQYAIRKIDGSNEVHTVAGEGRTNSYRYPYVNDITAGVAAGPDGSVYFSDAFLNVIRRIHPDGRRSIVAGIEERLSCDRSALRARVNGVPATESYTCRPTGLAMGPDGSLYFLESGATCVRKVDPSGKVATVAGQCWKASGGYLDAAEIADKPTLRRPTSIALLPDGSLVIVDGYEVKLLNKGIVYTILRGDSPVFRSQARLVAEAFGSVAYVDGSLYLASGNRVWVLDSLRPTATPKVSLLFSTETNPTDCGTGILASRARGDQVRKRVEASLSAICGGAELRAIAARGACTAEGGTRTVAFGQAFSYYAPNNNIVSISEPCRRRDVAAILDSPSLDGKLISATVRGTGYWGKNAAGFTQAAASQYCLGQGYSYAVDYAVLAQTDLSVPSVLYDGPTAQYVPTAANTAYKYFTSISCQ